MLFRTASDGKLGGAWERGQVPNTCGDTSILLSKYLNGHVGRIPYFAGSKVAENPVVSNRKDGSYLCVGAEYIHIHMHMPHIHVLAVATI